MKLVWSSLTLTLMLLVCVFGAGQWVGEWRVARPEKAARIDVCSKAYYGTLSDLHQTKKELEQCEALTRVQVEILDDDRKLSDDACDHRVEAIVRGTYPKGARLVQRSGVGAQEVEWFVGAGVPTGTCHAGSLYSRTGASPALYVCEDGAWKARL